MTNGDKTLNTGGGAAVGNNVQTDGDFVGRDSTKNINIHVVNWTEIGTQFISNLKDGQQREQAKQKELEKELEKLEEQIKESTKAQELAPILNKATQKDFDEVRQQIAESQKRIIELKKKVAESNNIEWAKAEQIYLDKVIKLYDRVRILGNSADVPLGDLFTQLYILDKPTARYRYDIEELRKRSGEHSEFQRQPGQRIHGLDLVKQGQNLFILGKPGAGKTTFLKYITIQAAHKLLSRVPMFVSLNQWADSRWGKGDQAALMPFLVEQFDICDFPDATLFIDYLLRDGRALVLFDGLDEVKQEKDQRRRLTHLLQEFAQRYDKSQHLITCRIATSDYAFAGFRDVEVADFTADQVHEYAVKWFGAENKKIDAFTNELANPENKGLAELCNTPLLLSLLCLTFNNDMRFPPSRAELYEDALETLLRKWDSSRQIQRDEIYRELSYKRKLQLLMNIAIPTFQKGELFFRQRDLEKWITDYLAKLPNSLQPDVIDGTAILKAIEAQHSILVERAQGIYSFSHLTFQEYLTARYLTENQGKETLDKLLRDRLNDRRWREVFLLTASLVDNGDGFINNLRRAIDDMVSSMPSLLNLLVWAYHRTRQSTSFEQQHITQLAYIFIALAFDFAFTNSIDLYPASVANFPNFFLTDHTATVALTRALELAFDLACTLCHDYSNVLDLDPIRTIALTITRALAIANVLAYTTTPLVGFDYGLYYIWCYSTLFANVQLDRGEEDIQSAIQTFPNLITGIIELANKGQQDYIVHHLLTEPIPLVGASSQTWQKYADNLLSMLRNKHSFGHEWGYISQNDDKLSAYFYTNELLIQCLKLCVVSNRQIILQQLLLPPSTS